MKKHHTFQTRKHFLFWNSNGHYFQSVHLPCQRCSLSSVVKISASQSCKWCITRSSMPSNILCVLANLSKTNNQAVRQPWRPSVQNVHTVSAHTYSVPRWLCSTRTHSHALPTLWLYTHATLPIGTNWQTKTTISTTTNSNTRKSVRYAVKRLWWRPMGSRFTESKRSIYSAFVSHTCLLAITMCPCPAVDRQ